MIEIVRNAATIAAVQRSHGGTTAAFRNDALFEWLKSKCPLQEIVSETEAEVFFTTDLKAWWNVLLLMQTKHFLLTKTWLRFKSIKVVQNYKGVFMPL